MNRMNRKRTSHTRFFVLLVLLLTLIGVRYAFQIDIPRPLFVAIIAVIAAMGDRDEILAMCMCCIPLCESVDFFYAIVICIAVYVFKFYGSVRVNMSILPVLLIVLWELLHCFEEDFSLVTFLTNIIPFLVLAIVMFLDGSKVNYDLIARAVALATAAVSLTLLLKVLYFADFNIAAAFVNLQRLGVETEEMAQKATVEYGNMNPNTLGIICVLASTGLMQLRIAGRGSKTDMLMVVILLVFGTLTSSRTYLACLAVMAILLLFSLKGNITQKLRFLGIILLTLILALGVLYAVFPGVLQYFYKRFLVEDITTGRADLMVRYHDFIMSNPHVMFLGIGLHDFGTKVLDVYRVTVNVPHNGFQEVWIAWGLPGLALFFTLLLQMVRRSKRLCSRQTLLNYIPLLIILAKSMAGQMINSSYTMLAFSFAYLSMCCSFEEKRALK